MIGWIIGLVMAMMAGITLLAVGVALRLHFLDERHIRERDDARAQRDRLNTRNAELVAEAEKLRTMVNDPQASRLARALEDSERELGECQHERRALALKLAEALSTRRTVPIKRIDATKPRHPQKSQEQEP